MSGANNEANFGIIFGEESNQAGRNINSQDSISCDIESVDESKPWNSVNPHARIKELEEENRKMCLGFNNQRAKMKELYVQTEKERDDLKTQLVLLEVKTQEEISSLHQIVQEKIDETDIFKVELERLKTENTVLRQENRQLKEVDQDQQQYHQNRHSQEYSGLAPQMLNQVKKTFTRKLVGDSPHQLSHSVTTDVLSPLFSASVHQDIADDYTNKGEHDTAYANEDPEVLSSLVTHLQEERDALKEKLRAADEILQTTKTKDTTNKTEKNVYIKNNAEMNKMLSDNNLWTTSNISPELYRDCIQCKKLQEELKTEYEKVRILEKQVMELEGDLMNEAALRRDLESEWQKNREAYKTEVHTLREQVGVNEKMLLDLQQRFRETKEKTLRQLDRLSEDREQVNYHLKSLQADNEYLSGRYMETAEEIQNQDINLPSDVNELHELVLQYQQKLITARLGCDYEKRLRLSSSDEIKLLREQLDANNKEYASYKSTTQGKMKSLQDRITEHLVKQQHLETFKTGLERRETELNRQITILRSEIIELQEENEKVKKFFNESKAKNKILQDELATSEEVQKDFVQLSQKLQMTLEQLRQADTEVRWQDDSDISNCPTCSRNFTVTLRKIHCRHCGRIFCDDCLAKTINSGPRQRPARVCDICHTLLLPNSAPYFSQTSAATSFALGTNLDPKH